MKRTHYLAAPRAFCITILVGVLNPAMTLSQETKAKSADTDTTRALDLKWIDAERALIQVQLEHVAEQNKRSPGSFPESMAEELRSRGTLFQEWRQQIESGTASFISLDVQKAKADLGIAERQLAADRHARAALSNAISKTQIKRRELEVQAARVWLDKVTHPSYQELSPDERNKWRLIILGKELLEMRLELRR